MTLTDTRPVEKTTRNAPAQLVRLILALLFLGGVVAFTSNAFSHVEQAYLLIGAAVVGGYMALNIGANDVANNVGPAVGSMALTMSAAIGIAAFFEASGAIIAGGDVVDTVKNGIIDPDSIGDPQVFVWVMLGALLGAAVWLNIATYLGAPVSTTHAIVGGVLGAGVAASGWAIVNWGVVGSIALSWVVSPVVGGLIAAGTLYLLKRTVLFTHRPVDAAVQVVPMLIAVMTWAFTTYLALKGLSNIVEIPVPLAMLIGLGLAAVTYAVVRPMVARAAPALRQDTEGVNSLFTIPLICSAALLSFAHGANDVANAVGPLAGIVEVLDGGAAGGEVGIPLWVLVVGALGISLGLALYGPRLIRTVGTEITELDRSRAFCVALAAALTVIVASQLGLPVSSTHVALGGIFGVGFLREFLENRMNRAIEKVLQAHRDDRNLADVEYMLEEFREASSEDKRRMLDTLQGMGSEAVITAAQNKKLRKGLKRQLVRRSHMLRIASAWVVTVPVAAALSALFFFALRGMMVA